MFVRTSLFISDGVFFPGKVIYVTSLNFAGGNIYISLVFTYYEYVKTNDQFMSLTVLNFQQDVVKRRTIDL